MTQTKQNKKRFLFLITHFYPTIYGAELCAFEISKRLAQQGHTVDVVTGKWDKSWSKFERVAGVNIYRVKTLKIRYIQTVFFIIPQLLKAQKLITANKYDFVHAHIYPSSITGSLLATPVGTSKIATVQGGDLADYQPVFGHFAPLLKPIISQSLKQYSTIHVVSSYLANKVKVMTKKSSVIVPNGVNELTAALKSSKSIVRHLHNLPQKGPMIFSSSRLTLRSNLFETIKAVSLVRKKTPNAFLVIVGEGYLEKKIKLYITSNNFDPFIFLLGGVPHKQALQLTKIADVTVRVSLYEGFGISLLEGLALKTPVVSTRVGGLKDFINHDNAFIPKTTKAKPIAQAISEALSPQAKKKIHSGYLLYKKHYTWEKVFEKTKSKIYGL